MLERRNEIRARKKIRDTRAIYARVPRVHISTHGVDKINASNNKQRTPTLISTSDKESTTCDLEQRKLVHAYREP